MCYKGLHYKDLTLTCSLEVTAQKTISVKPWEGNIRKQIPPITLLSFTRAKHLCFLKKRRVHNLIKITNSFLKSSLLGAVYDVRLKLNVLVVE